MPKVWGLIASALDRVADECELICKRYLYPQELMSEKTFKMLAKAIGSRSGPAERAAKLVFVGGVKPSQAAKETGLMPQDVYAATNRYKRALLVFQNASSNEET